MFKNKKSGWIGLVFLIFVLILVVATSCKSTAPAPTTPAPTQTPKVINVASFVKNYLDEKYERGDRVAVAGIVTEVKEFLPPGAKDYGLIVIKVTLGPVYTAKDRGQYVVVAEFPEMEYSLAIKFKENFDALKGKEVIIGGAVYRISPKYRTEIFLNDSILLKEAP